MSLDTLSWRVKFNTKKKTKEDVFAEILFRDNSKPDLEIEEKDAYF